MYLQSWSSHLIEMDNLPLNPISKSFCGYKGHDKIWESQAKGKRQEPLAGRRWQQLPRGPTRNDSGLAVQDCRRCNGKICLSSHFFSQSYPHGQELELSNRNCHSDDTVPEEPPHSHHFSLPVTQNPPHRLPLLQQTVEDAVLEIYMVW